MIPGPMGKTGCKKGFVPDGQTVLPTDALVKGPQGMPFLAGIQWGSSSYGSITFPLAFSIWNRMYGGYNGSANRLIRFQDRTLTRFTLQVYDVDSKTLNGDSSFDGMWLAVGV